MAAAGARPRRRLRHPAAYLALLPAATIVVVAYLGCLLWTARLSFTSSKLLPKLDWIGFSQYQRLFENERFILSIENIATFGLLYLVGALILGFLDLQATQAQNAVYNDLDDPNTNKPRRIIMAEVTLKGLAGLSGNLSNLLRQKILGYTQVETSWNSR